MDFMRMMRPAPPNALLTEYLAMTRLRISMRSHASAVHVAARRLSRANVLRARLRRRPVTTMLDVMQSALPIFELGFADEPSSGTELVGCRQCCPNRNPFGGSLAPGFTAAGACRVSSRTSCESAFQLH